MQHAANMCLRTRQPKQAPLNAQTTDRRACDICSAQQVKLSTREFTTIRVSLAGRPCGPCSCLAGVCVHVLLMHKNTPNAYVQRLMHMYTYTLYTYYTRINASHPPIHPWINGPMDPWIHACMHACMHAYACNMASHRSSPRHAHNATSCHTKYMM